MTGLPPWLSGYAALDDPSLAVLANPGLVRRGAAEVGAGRVRLISVGEDAVRVGVGNPQAIERCGPSFLRLLVKDLLGGGSPRRFAQRGFQLGPQLAADFGLELGSLHHTLQHELQALLDSAGIGGHLAACGT